MITFVFILTRPGVGLHLTVKLEYAAAPLGGYTAVHWCTHWCTHWCALVVHLLVRCMLYQVVLVAAII